MWTNHPDDERLVSDALRELALDDVRQDRPPDPSFIWWKAQLLRRLDAEREATAPLDVGDRMHIGAAVLGVVALAAGAWDYLPALTALTATTGVTVVLALVVLLTVATLAAVDVLRER
ncbi:MAG: hypothetical protein QM736_24350 [Vicinamibacterales bacterium]